MYTCIYTCVCVFYRDFKYNFLIPSSIFKSLALIFKFLFSQITNLNINHTPGYRNIQIYLILYIW